MCSSVYNVHLVTIADFFIDVHLPISHITEREKINNKILVTYTQQHIYITDQCLNSFISYIVSKNVTRILKLDLIFINFFNIAKHVTE